MICILNCNRLVCLSANAVAVWADLRGGWCVKSDLEDFGFCIRFICSNCTDTLHVGCSAQTAVKSAPAISLRSAPGWPHNSAR